MNPRISLITLGVVDLQRSIRFYEQGLGLPRMESPPEVAFFPLNGTWLGLYGRQALAKDAGVPPQGGGFEGITIAHNVTFEAEVDAPCARGRRRRRHADQARTKNRLGRVLGILRRSGRASLGNRP